MIVYLVYKKLILKSKYCPDCYSRLVFSKKPIKKVIPGEKIKEDTEIKLKEESLEDKIVKIYCPFCGHLIENNITRCPLCQTPLNVG